VVRSIHKAFVSDYAYERSSFASNVSSMLNGNVNTRLVGKVIMPIASNMISNFSE
jgi:hypothetical protein